MIVATDAFRESISPPSSTDAIISHFPYDGSRLPYSDHKTDRSVRFKRYMLSLRPYRHRRTIPRFFKSSHAAIFVTFATGIASEFAPAEVLATVAVSPTARRFGMITP